MQVLIYYNDMHSLEHEISWAVGQLFFMLHVSKYRIQSLKIRKTKWKSLHLHKVEDSRLSFLTLYNLVAGKKMAMLINISGKE